MPNMTVVIVMCNLLMSGCDFVVILSVPIYRLFSTILPP